MTISVQRLWILESGNQEAARLLLPANRLPEGRLLHEFGAVDPLAADRVHHIKTPPLRLPKPRGARRSDQGGVIGVTRTSPRPRPEEKFVNAADADDPGQHQGRADGKKRVRAIR